jgi:hypothetical protein
MHRRCPQAGGLDEVEELVEAVQFVQPLSFSADTRNRVKESQ